MKNMLRVNHLLMSFLLSLVPIAPAHAQIDLHAHLHMKPGMGFFLQGSWQEDPRAQHWSDRIYTKTSSTSLAATAPEQLPKLIVVSLYAHPYLSYSWKRDGFHFDRKKNVREAIEREYWELNSFVHLHSNHFAIARNAQQAREIIKSARTAIVISIEGAWATLDSPEDYDRWTNERGLAIVTPVHLTPDSLGNNALMSAVNSFFNSTFDFFASVYETRGACLKHFCKSTKGFTSEGYETVEQLMKHQIWVDLAHANELEVTHLIQKYETAALPLLVTHTQLRDFYPVERGLGQQEVNYIRKHEGIVGLIPSEFMMAEAMKQAEAEVLAQHPEESSKPSAASGLTCISGLDIYKKTIAYTIATLGAPERVAMASDINAPLNGLSPGCGTVAGLTPTQLDLHRKGYYTYSQWSALADYAAPDSQWNQKILDHFLLLWEKIRPTEKTKTSSSKHPL